MASCVQHERKGKRDGREPKQRRTRLGPGRRPGDHQDHPQASGGGAWVCGTIHGHRFDALVFPEHADNADWEIGDSRISKLWLQRQADKKTVYNWDRGLDLAPGGATAAAIVDFLCAGLAEHTYGK